jgi:hypothetical protein
MLNREDLLCLMKTVAKAEPSMATAFSYNDKSYSYGDLNETLRQEMNEYVGSYSLYRENKNLLFSLVEETMDEVLPKKVLDQYGAFADVRTFAQGDKPIFVQRTGKQRAKQFITKVGLAGRYEVFKLGSKTIEVPTEAIGGAAQIGLEEFLDGRVDFAELTSIIMEGMDEVVYKEIAAGLIASTENMQAVNKVNADTFNEEEFDGLLTISDSYGVSTIYCTFEFAAKMLPADNWVSDDMRNERWANGYFTTYKGHRVIVLPQSFTDETNSTKVIDPSYCWIIPSGSDKPVKVAFEGQTLVRDIDSNEDWSKEIQVYKKLGVAVIMTNGITVYHDESLSINTNA